MSEGDDYVCTLDERTLEKAKLEINEDPKERMSQVKAFREWVKKQPHLSCPTGKHAMWTSQTCRECNIIVTMVIRFCILLFMLASW